jgi:hypothetical protein
MVPTIAENVDGTHHIDKIILVSKWKFFFIIMRERTIMMKLDHAHEVDDMDET